MALSPESGYVHITSQGTVNVDMDLEASGDAIRELFSPNTLPFEKNANAKIQWPDMRLSRTIQQLEKNTRQVYRGLLIDRLPTNQRDKKSVDKALQVERASRISRAVVKLLTLANYELRFMTEKQRTDLLAALRAAHSKAYKKTSYEAIAEAIEKADLKPPNIYVPPQNQIIVERMRDGEIVFKHFDEFASELFKPNVVETKLEINRNNSWPDLQIVRLFSPIYDQSFASSKVDFGKPPGRMSKSDAFTWKMNQKDKYRAKKAKETLTRLLREAKARGVTPTPSQIQELVKGLKFIGTYMLSDGVYMAMAEAFSEVYNYQPAAAATSSSNNSDITVAWTNDKTVRIDGLKENIQSLFEPNKTEWPPARMRKYTSVFPNTVFSRLVWEIIAGGLLKKHSPVSQATYTSTRNTIDEILDTAVKAGVRVSIILLDEIEDALVKLQDHRVYMDLSDTAYNFLVTTKVRLSRYPEDFKDVPPDYAPTMHPYLDNNEDVRFTRIDKGIKGLFRKNNRPFNVRLGSELVWPDLNIVRIVLELDSFHDPVKDMPLDYAKKAAALHQLLKHASNNDVRVDIITREMLVDKFYRASEAFLTTTETSRFFYTRVANIIRALPATQDVSSSTLLYMFKTYAVDELTKVVKQIRSEGLTVTRDAVKPVAKYINNLRDAGDVDRARALSKVYRVLVPKRDKTSAASSSGAVAVEDDGAPAATISSRDVTRIVLEKLRNAELSIRALDDDDEATAESAVQIAQAALRALSADLDEITASNFQLQSSGTKRARPMMSRIKAAIDANNLQELHELMPALTIDDRHIAFDAAVAASNVDAISAIASHL